MEGSVSVPWQLFYLRDPFGATWIQGPCIDSRAYLVDYNSWFDKSMTMPQDVVRRWFEADGKQVESLLSCGKFQYKVSSPKLPTSRQI